MRAVLAAAVQSPAKSRARSHKNQNSCFLINIPLVILLHYIHINIIKTKSSVIQSQYYKLRNIRLEELSSNSCLAFVMFHFLSFTKDWEEEVSKLNFGSISLLTYQRHWPVKNKSSVYVVVLEYMYLCTMYLALT